MGVCHIMCVYVCVCACVCACVCEKLHGCMPHNGDVLAHIVSE